MTARRASWMLVAVTALWGVSFSWTYSWLNATRAAGFDELLSSLTLIGLRMPLALLMLGLWRPSLVFAPSRREHLGGAAIGAVFCVGFILQTWGLATTTPALSGFFTALCNAWAPLIALVFLREKVAPLTLLGLSVAFAGCAVLVNGWHFAFGDWLTVGSSVMFAVQMLLLDRLGKSLDPANFSASFLGTTGLMAIACAVTLASAGVGVGEWLGWAWSMLSRWDMLLLVFTQALFPSAMAFHWMNTYQPLVPVSRAALIYLLEPVFAAAASLLIGHESLTPQLVAGGVLIVGGNLLVELPRLIPLWRRARYDAPGENVGA
jgi:drug/metabolite transporter (DMT)-like permease